MRYAVFNPTDGVYTKHDDVESARQKLFENMVAFYLWQTHNTPVSLITITDAGEQWQGLDEAATKEILPKMATN